MNDWTKLSRDLEDGGPLDAERCNELKEKIHRETERQRKKWIISLTLYCLVGLIFMLNGGLVIRDTENIRFMFLGAALIIIGFEITVLVKLAYGSFFSMSKILETVREAQISVLEHIDAGGGQRKNEEIGS